MVHYGKGQNQIKQNKFVCTKTKAFTASFNRERYQNTYKTINTDYKIILFVKW